MNWYKSAQIEEPYFPVIPTIPVDLAKSQKDVDELKDNWIPVESSFITHVSYYEPLGMFEIKLKDGSKYSYKNVPKKVFRGFMRATSKGQFFNRVIKPKYEEFKQKSRS
jgi:hypothetical protein